MRHIFTCRYIKSSLSCLSQASIVFMTDVFNLSQPIRIVVRKILDQIYAIVRRAVIHKDNLNIFQCLFK